ncbi:MAG: hypothetical protein D6753_06665 [Planctomycetota bacterium]|nr:MAG: hypothetical protein D6753_06665 [Planctomycetota bacterium]
MISVGMDGGGRLRRAVGASVRESTAHEESSAASVAVSQCSLFGPRLRRVVALAAVCWCLLAVVAPAWGQRRQNSRPVDGRNTKSGIPDPPEDPELQQYGIYAATAPRPAFTHPVPTQVPLRLKERERIAMIGNTLFDRDRNYAHFETLVHQAFPDLEVTVRNLAWAADAVDIQPRPANFADVFQHLTHERADLVLAAYGFNESFDGTERLEAFRAKLGNFVRSLKESAFNGSSGPRVVLVSPIANENVPGVSAADQNNNRLRLYVEVMRQVAEQEEIGFIDMFSPMLAPMADSTTQLTINGVHLNEEGYRLFGAELFRQLFGLTPPPVDEQLRQLVIDKNRQFFRRYRPANTFYYTGNRSKAYGYLDFLPAMRNFDLMVANRDRLIHRWAQGDRSQVEPDDSNLPPLPPTKQSRGANRWLTPAEELAEFEVDPRFEVTLFASEEQFPEIAAPIQIRWDSRGRMWVSCSTTYPHVYPGNEPDDRLVILEDVDGDGRADKSTVFAEGLHIPLSFEFGDGGVYVSEMPDLTFLKDTDGDDRADVREQLLTGFGTEDSHHALHDFVWSPDGDLLIRESIFHHTQVETPYGPVRQQNSGWFRFEPDVHRLTSFGTYHSTNPWGVTFDAWGQHVASHPIYAAAFHSLDPPYPDQHPKPDGLRAYSGTCGHEFIDFATFPADMQGGFVKVRYKPTNRVEFHRWHETEFGFDEEYVGDIVFSKNLSFIPVDVRFGPRGALYVCDWYNPIKGHAQYSLRDPRRDRHSGRIWRITAKGIPLQDPPRIADASVDELVAGLQRPESRIRYWIRRELRERDADEVARAVERFVRNLDPNEPGYRHHQVEAVWVLRGVRRPNYDLLRDLLACEHHLARAAATEQLRYWHAGMPDAIDLLRRAANDPSSIVRMQAAIAASYIGTEPALDAILDIFHHPLGGHLEYALTCALGSRTLRPIWENNPKYDVGQKLRQTKRRSALAEPPPSASEAQFDSQKNLLTVRIGCIPERMKYTQEQFIARPGQPVKLVFSNGDATDHNLVIVRPGAMEEVGMAANAMARDPKNANSDFIPPDKQHLILQAAPMIGPTRKSLVHVLRFEAPREPGVYPYVCTFPGHWVIMNGRMIVARNPEEAEELIRSAEPALVQHWTMNDLQGLTYSDDEANLMRGMQAFAKARCDQCHQLAGHGVNLGPDLAEIGKRFQGDRLLEQIINPSAEINEKFQTIRFLLDSGEVVAGVVQSEDDDKAVVMTNLLTPDRLTIVDKSTVELRSPSRVSSMPTGLVDVLTREEIAALVSMLQAGPDKLPGHHGNGHGH